jgi:hypothetical protein
MALSFQDIKPADAAALNKQSQGAYDTQLTSRQALVNQQPALQAGFNQGVHTQSCCGCGCQQIVAGYFNFQACGCGCYPQTEVMSISSSLSIIGPNAPQQGSKVRFSGQATGTGTPLNISNVYLQGTVPDAENLIGVPLTLNLYIGQGSISLTILEGARVLAVLVHPPQYAANINGQFYGSGTGVFMPA